MRDEGPRRILLVKLSSIGDVVHTIPGSALLNEHYPAAAIDWLVEEAAAPIVRELPWVRRTLVLDAISPTALRRERYDLAVDLQGLLRSSLLTLLSGSRLRLGRGRWPWLHLRVPMFDHAATPHAVENTARPLQALGVPPGGLPGAGAEFLRAWAERLRARGAEVAAAVGIRRPFWAWFPWSRWPSKDLPLDEVPATGTHVLLGAGEGAFARVGFHSLAGRLPLLDSVAVALAAERVVAADTGPAHLAALLGARITGVYGPTRARHTGLRGAAVENVESSCGGCFARRCARARSCMKEALRRALGPV